MALQKRFLLLRISPYMVHKAHYFRPGRSPRFVHKMGRLTQSFLAGPRWSIYHCTAASEFAYLTASASSFEVAWISWLSRNYAAGASMIWNPRLAALRLR